MGKLTCDAHMSVLDVWKYDDVCTKRLVPASRRPTLLDGFRSAPRTCADHLHGLAAMFGLPFCHARSTNRGARGSLA